MFDFDLSDEEMSSIAALDAGERTGPNPDTFVRPFPPPSGVSGLHASRAPRRTDRKSRSSSLADRCALGRQVATTAFWPWTYGQGQGQGQGQGMVSIRLPGSMHLTIIHRRGGSPGKLLRRGYEAPQGPRRTRLGAWLIVLVSVLLVAAAAVLPLVRSSPAGAVPAKPARAAEKAALGICPCPSSRTAARPIAARATTSRARGPRCSLPVMALRSR